MMFKRLEPNSYPVDWRNESNGMDYDVLGSDGSIIRIHEQYEFDEVDYPSNWRIEPTG